VIDKVLKLNNAKFYEIHSYQEIANPVTGSKGKEYAYLTQTYAYIQPTGSKGNVKGVMLQNTRNSGDKVVADLFMYHKEKRNEKERVLYQGLFYEIRSVEYYDNDYLKFYKSYLVKVDNQNVK
jgi:hypothetical protein